MPNSLKNLFISLLLIFLSTGYTQDALAAPNYVWSRTITSPTDMSFDGRYAIFSNSVTGVKYGHVYDTRLGVPILSTSWPLKFVPGTTLISTVSYDLRENDYVTSATTLKEFGPRLQFRTKSPTVFAVDRDLRAMVYIDNGNIYFAGSPEVGFFLQDPEATSMTLSIPHNRIVTMSQKWVDVYTFSVVNPYNRFSVEGSSVVNAHDQEPVFAHAEPGGLVRIRSLIDGSEISRFQAPGWVDTLDFSPDAHYVHVKTGNDRIVAEVNSGKVIYQYRANLAAKGGLRYALRRTDADNPRWTFHRVDSPYPIGQVRNWTSTLSDFRSIGSWFTVLSPMRFVDQMTGDLGPTWINDKLGPSYAPSHDETLVASCSGTNNLYVYRLSDRNEVMHFTLPKKVKLPRLRWRRGDREIYVIDYSFPIDKWQPLSCDLTTGIVKEVPLSLEPNAVEYSAYLDAFLVSLCDGIVSYDASSLLESEMIYPFSSYRRQIKYLSSNGRLLVLERSEGGYSGADFYDVATRKQVNDAWGISMRINATSRSGISASWSYSSSPYGNSFVSASANLMTNGSAGDNTDFLAHTTGDDGALSVSTSTMALVRYSTAVSGESELQDVISFDLRRPAAVMTVGLGGTIMTETTLTPFSRFLTGQSLLTGSYRVWIKPKGFLSVAEMNYVVPQDHEKWVRFSFINGDISDDNKIDLKDFEVFVSEYQKLDGQEGVTSPADLNGDGVVGTDDYLIISKNFGKVGESL